MVVLFWLLVALLAFIVMFLMFPIPLWAWIIIIVAVLLSRKAKL